MFIRTYQRRKTLSKDNEFRFQCPIFGVETKIASCFELHRLYAMGKDIEVRKGCQTCMEANKCPVWHIHQEMLRSGEDPYHSAEPVVGKLKSSILERIARITVPPHILKRLEDGAEKRRIIAANEAAGQSIKVEKTEKKTATKSVAKTAAVPEKSLDAAMTGDMAEALNRELAK
jgi:hypothetical protein